MPEETQGNQPIDEIKEFIRDSVKEIEKENITPLGWKIFSSDSILKIDIKKSEFIVENLIPAGCITILSGQPGIGKGWLLLEIARCVGSGNPLFMGSPTYESFNRFAVKEARILYVDEESTAAEIKRRWELLKPPMCTLVDFATMNSLKIDNEEDRKTLLDFAVHKGVKLIIFDSFRDMHLLDENNSKDAQSLIDYFREFTAKDIAVLISHHNKKESFLNSKDPAQVLRGSSAILAGIDSLLAVEKFKELENRIEWIVSQAKLRQGRALLPFKVVFQEKDGVATLSYEGEVENEVKKREKAKEMIKKLLSEGEKYSSEIVQQLIPFGIGERTIKSAITELKDNQEIKPRKDKNKTYYSL